METLLCQRQSEFKSEWSTGAEAAWLEFNSRAWIRNVALSLLKSRRKRGFS